MSAGVRQIVGPIVAVALFALAMAALHFELAATTWKEVAAAFGSIPPVNFLYATLAVVLGYAVWVGLDLLALRYAGAALPLRQVALESFVGSAFAQNLGLSFVAAAAARWRLLASWGLEPAAISRVIGFIAGIFLLGGAFWGGLVVFAADPAVLHLDGGRAWLWRWLGGLMLAVAASGVLTIALRRNPLRIRHLQFPLPSIGSVTGGLGIFALRWLFGALALAALIPPPIDVAPATFLGAFLVARGAGFLSGLPMGAGVFDATIMLLLTRWFPTPVVASALVAYRVVSVVLPLMVALLLLAGQEALRQSARFGPASEWLQRWNPAFVARLLSAATLVGGTIVLLAGAFPGEPVTPRWFVELVPAWLVETSHLLSVAAGVGLIILSRGIHQRVRSAFWWTCGFLALGIVLTIARGFDYAEATVLGFLLGAIWPCQRYFFREGSMPGIARGPAAWAAAGIVVLGCLAIWLSGAGGAESLDPERMLRALVDPAVVEGRPLRAVLMVFGIGLVWFGADRLVRPPSPAFEPPSADQQETVATILAGSLRASAQLARLGDKHLFFADDARSFVMYGISGHAWISMGDPVGPADALAETAWQFRREADRFGGVPVFYEVPVESIPAYLDIGLQVNKIGEEARIPLADFSLKGSPRRQVRQACNRVNKAGCRFEWAGADELDRLWPELMAVSDAWLTTRSAREKGFSMGVFERSYLEGYPLALVRGEDGRLLAFANLWQSAERAEVQIDLMRHVPDAPQGVMEFLFAESMLRVKEEGYAYFNLGMAPLSGLATGHFAPAWDQVGGYLFRHGEQFYNFQGLRRFKQKFAPVWEPRYMASPGGLALPRLLAQVTTLISGGISGVFGK